MTARAYAQDPFEIHIYEYEPLAWREYSLEGHLNLTTGTSCSRRFPAANQPQTPYA